MRKGTLLNKWLIVLCALLLTVSLFAVPVFADETEGSSENESTEESSTEEGTTEAGTTEAGTTEAGTTGSSSTDKKEDEKKGLSTQAIVWIVVGAVVVVVGAVLGVKFREKIQKSLRVYKSEMKKIVWLPWDQTKKSTWIVLVVLVVCAAVICLLDVALSKGFMAFINLF